MELQRHIQNHRWLVVRAAVKTGACMVTLEAAAYIHEACNSCCMTVWKAVPGDADIASNTTLMFLVTLDTCIVSIQQLPEKVSSEQLRKLCQGCMVSSTMCCCSFNRVMVEHWAQPADMQPHSWRFKCCRTHLVKSCKGVSWLES
jgi:hypothetical protein